MDSTRRGRDVAIWLVLCAGIVTGCGITGDPPERTAEAEQYARGVAAQIVTDLQARRNPDTRTADQIGRALAVRPEANLIAISGVDTAHPAGVTAVIRIEGSGTDGSWLEPEFVVEDFCFELRFAPPLRRPRPRSPARHLPPG
ncbi:hypothetical protein GA0074692_5499 [Micromonospora pallida]|uniref:Lipoprotein n=1 Tax=Micromonospora pallida TaxID=145854 RepID=A0A1C6TDQ6_9ACTN|nr:hypothetical protein [Micromonospora pallida]SCL39829.1 hypothetical protein GA0074692_5499 [Micromonospora pallida]